MHKITLMLVKADNDEEANEKAQEAFDYLIDNSNGGHDYFTIFNSEGDHTFSTTGSDRFGEQASPIRTDTEIAKSTLAEYLGYITQESKKHMANVKELIETKSYDDIMNDMMDLYEFSCVDLDDIANSRNRIYSAYEDSSLEPIFTQKKLDNALKDHNYLVLADVHF